MGDGWEVFVPLVMRVCLCLASVSLFTPTPTFLSHHLKIPFAASPSPSHALSMRLASLNLCTLSVKPNCLLSQRLVVSSLLSDCVTCAHYFGHHTLRVRVCVCVRSFVSTSQELLPALPHTTPLTERCRRYCCEDSVETMTCREN